MSLTKVPKLAIDSNRPIMATRIIISTSVKPAFGVALVFLILIFFLFF